MDAALWRQVIGGLVAASGLAWAALRLSGGRGGGEEPPPKRRPRAARGRHSRQGSRRRSRQPSRTPAETAQQLHEEALQREESEARPQGGTDDVFYSLLGQYATLDSAASESLGARGGHGRDAAGGDDGGYHEHDDVGDDDDDDDASWGGGGSGGGWLAAGAALLEASSESTPARLRARPRSNSSPDGAAWAGRPEAWDAPRERPQGPPPPPRRREDAGENELAWGNRRSGSVLFPGADEVSSPARAKKQPLRHSQSARTSPLREAGARRRSGRHSRRASRQGRPGPPPVPPPRPSQQAVRGAAARRRRSTSVTGMAGMSESDVRFMLGQA